MAPSVCVTPYLLLKYLSILINVCMDMRYLRIVKIGRVDVFLCRTVPAQRFLAHLNETGGTSKWIRAAGSAQLDNREQRRAKNLLISNIGNFIPYIRCQLWSIPKR